MENKIGVVRHIESRAGQVAATKIYFELEQILIAVRTIGCAYLSGSRHMQRNETKRHVGGLGKF
jgi:hypothetical protein